MTPARSTLSAPDTAVGQAAPEPQPGAGTYTWEADCYGSWLLAIRVFRLRLLLERGERERAEEEAREYGIGMGEI